MDGISVVIKKDGKYMMIQQAKGRPFQLKWMAVSGAINEDETKEESVIRETKEEVGLDIEILREIATLKSDWKSENTHFFIANWKSGKIKADPREINKYGWFTYEEILELDLMPATKVFFEKHFRPF
ncbi:MAG: NUDIX hydrolase [Candidatus Aenigmarchaeota archaeon]|nr:NUDIX hydrolase [Candidatus Aenigmarchaeota archaeon]